MNISAPNEGFELERETVSTDSAKNNAYLQKSYDVIPLAKPETDSGHDIIVIPERCPKATEICINGCEDSLEVNAGEVFLESHGCILQLDVKLKNVCPKKRVALAVILTEKDKSGCEHNRGMKTLTVPAHNGKYCADITVKCIKFVLPENIETPKCNDASCGKRIIKTRIIANYIDTDFKCCNFIK